MLRVRPKILCSVALVIAFLVTMTPASVADHEPNGEQHYVLRLNDGVTNVMTTEDTRHYYQLEVGTGAQGLGHANMQIWLNHHASNCCLKLFVGYEEIPDPESCDSPTCQQGESTEGKMCILLPPEGTWHLLVTRGTSASPPFVETGYGLSAHSDRLVPDVESCTTFGISP